jgi:hypothetical protein
MPLLTLYRPSFRGAAAIAVLLAWIASLGWLAMREFGKTDAASMSSEATLRLAPGSVWYALYAGQVQIGNAGLTLDTLSPGYRITESVMTEIPRGALLLPASRHTETWLGATLNVERVLSHVTWDGHPLDWSVSVFDDTATARLTGAITAQGQANLNAAPSTPAIVPYRLALGGDLKAGHEHGVVLLDGWPLAGGRATVAIGADSTIRFADSSVAGAGSEHRVVAHYDSAHVYAVTLNTATGPRRLWVGDDGTVSAQETVFGVRWMRTDFDISETEFRESLAGRTTAIVAQLPPLGRLIGAGGTDTATRTRRFLVQHRDGTAVDTALLARLGGGRQRIAGDTITVLAQPPRDAAEANSDTTADPMIQSDGAAIDTLQADLITMPIDAHRLGPLISAFRQRIRIDTTTGAPDDALNTAGRRRGSPDGVARLFVALLRAAGVSARYVIGVCPAGNRLLTHAWVEVWDARAGNWTAVDPVMQQAAASTGLIRLAFAGSSAPHALLMLVANARLTELPGGSTP